MMQMIVFKSSKYACSQVIYPQYQRLKKKVWETSEKEYGSRSVTIKRPQIRVTMIVMARRDILLLWKAFCIRTSWISSWWHHDTAEKILTYPQGTQERTVGSSGKQGKNQDNKESAAAMLRTR
jgi:hypothetical protein